MKVYRSKDQQKKKVNKKALVSVGVSLALLAAALAITLTLALNGNSPLIPEPEPEPTGTTPVYVLPVNTFEVGKTFSDQDLVKFITTRSFETHEAIDFLVDAGTDVKAIYDGTILSVNTFTSTDGTVIKIQHANGIVSVYKGLGETTMETGATVKAGDVIGVVGRMTVEAREYDSPHLHLEVLKNGKTVNPLDYLPEIGDK